MRSDFDASVPWLCSDFTASGHRHRGRDACVTTKHPKIKFVPIKETRTRTRAAMVWFPELQLPWAPVRRPADVKPDGGRSEAAWEL